MLCLIVLFLVTLAVTAFNLWVAIGVGHWMIDRFSPEITVISVIVVCFPSFLIAMAWL